MKLGLHINDFTWPGGPGRLGADLARVARTAEEAGFDRVENVGAIIDALGGLAAQGFEVAHGGVANVSTITPLEIIGREVIPAVATL